MSEYERSARLLASWLRGSDPEVTLATARNMVRTALRNPGFAVVSAGSETREVQVLVLGSVVAVTPL